MGTSQLETLLRDLYQSLRKSQGIYIYSNSANLSGAPEVLEFPIALIQDLSYFLKDYPEIQGIFFEYGRPILVIFNNGVKTEIYPTDEYFSEFVEDLYNHFDMEEDEDDTESEEHL